MCLDPQGVRFLSRFGPKMGTDFRVKVCKMVLEIYVFWSETWSGFNGEQGGTPPAKITRNTPWVSTLKTTFTQVVKTSIHFTQPTGQDQPASFPVVLGV